METPNKGGRKLPMFTPKNPDGSQRVIKQIMVIDPKKLQVAGLDLKMAEALRKAKAPTVGSSPAVRSKDDKLALVKSILNKKLKREEAARKLIKPNIKVTDLQSLMPPPTLPISPPTNKPHTVLLNFTNPDHDRACVEVNILDSSTEPQKKIDPAQIPKASLQKSKAEIPKTIQSKIITRELRFEVKKKQPQPRVKEESSSPEDVLIKVIESKVDSPKEKYALPSIPTKDVLLKVIGSKVESPRATPDSPEGLIKVIERKSESPRTTYASPSIPTNDVVIKVTESKAESPRATSDSPSIATKGVLVKVTESKAESLKATSDPAIAEKVMIKVIESKAESPREAYAPPSVRQKHLPKVIESKVLTPEEKIDLNTLCVKSSTKAIPACVSLAISRPIGQEKAILNVTELNSSKVRECPEFKAEAGLQNVIRSSERDVSSPQVVEESAVDFVNNLFQSKLNQDRIAKAVPKKEIKVVEEDATSFLMSLFGQQAAQSKAKSRTGISSILGSSEQVSAMAVSEQSFESIALPMNSEKLPGTSSLAERVHDVAVSPLKSEKLLGTERAHIDVTDIVNVPPLKCPQRGEVMKMTKGKEKPSSVCVPESEIDSPRVIQVDSSSLAQKVHPTDADDVAVSLQKSDMIPGKERLKQRVHINVIEDVILSPPNYLQKEINPSKCKEKMPKFSEIEEPANNPITSVIQVRSSNQKETESLVHVQSSNKGVFSFPKTLNLQSSNESPFNFPNAESAVYAESSSQKCTDLLGEQPAEKEKTMVNQEQLAVRNPIVVSSIIIIESSFTSKEEKKQTECNIVSDQGSIEERESLTPKKHEHDLTELQTSTEEKDSIFSKKDEEGLTKLAQLNPTNENTADETKVVEEPSAPPPITNTRRKGKKSIPVLIAKLNRNRKTPASQEKSAEQVKKVSTETTERIKTKETIESLQVSSESLHQDESLALIKTVQQVEFAETLEKTIVVSTPQRRDTTRSNQPVFCENNANGDKKLVEQLCQPNVSKVSDEKSEPEIQVDDKQKEIAEGLVSAANSYNPRDMVKHAEVAITSPESVIFPSPTKNLEKLEIPRSSFLEKLTSSSYSQSLTKPDEITSSEIPGSSILRESDVPTPSCPQAMIKPASLENSESSVSTEKSASPSSGLQGMTKSAEITASPESEKRGTQNLENTTKSLDISLATADGIITTQTEDLNEQNQQDPTLETSKKEKLEGTLIPQELMTPQKKTRQRTALKCSEKPENAEEAVKTFDTIKGPKKIGKEDDEAKVLDTSFAKCDGSIDKPQENPEQYLVKYQEKETKSNPLSNRKATQMREVDLDTNEIVEIPCNSRVSKGRSRRTTTQNQDKTTKEDKSQEATSNTTGQSRNKSKPLSKTPKNQDQSNKLKNTTDHLVQETKNMKKVESEEPSQISSKDTFIKSSQANSEDTSMPEEIEKIPVQDQTNSNIIPVEMKNSKVESIKSSESTPSTSRTRRSTKAKKTDEPEEIIPQTKKSLRGKKAVSQEQVNIANVPDSSLVVSEGSNLLIKNIAGSNPLTKDIATVSDSSPIRPEDSNPLNKNIVTVSDSSPIRPADSNQAITESSKQSKEEVKSPPRNRKRTAKFDEYCKNFTEHLDQKCNQSMETTFRGPEAGAKPLECVDTSLISYPQTATPTGTTQTKRKSRLEKGKINLVQRKSTATKASGCSVAQSDATKSLELEEKLSIIVKSEKPDENIQEKMNLIQKKTPSTRRSDVDVTSTDSTNSSALKKLTELLENRRPTEDIIESEDNLTSPVCDSPNIFDESIGFDEYDADSGMAVTNNDIGTGESIQQTSGVSSNKLSLQEKPQNQEKTKNPFRKIKEEKDDEEKAKDKIEIAFLGFNEKEIKEGQQSTSLRLSQSDDVAPAQIISPPPCTSKKKNLPRIKKTPLNSGKKLKEEQQNWKKNSADSLKNWLTVPGTSSEAELVNVQVQQEINEMNSLIPLKKRWEREQNPNESPTLNSDVMSIQEYIYRPIKKEDIQESPPQLDLVAIQRKIMETTGQSQQAIEQYGVTLEAPKTVKPKAYTKATVTPSKPQSNRKITSVSKESSAPSEDNSGILSTPVGNKSGRKPRKIKTDNTPTSAEGDIVKAPTKRKSQKRKNSTGEETTPEAEPPFKMPHLNTGIVPVFTPPAARRRGRPPKVDGPYKPPPASMVPFCHLDRKYKNDTEFNPRLLLIRKKEELKSDDPLIDPDKQTAPKNRDDVQCALCMGYSSSKKWIHHISSHYGIGWAVGTQPPLNITSRASVLNYMVEFFKVSKVKGLNCRLCQGQRRSALGLLLHLELCCLTEEELRESRVECKHCKNNYSRSTILTHARTCRALVKATVEGNGEKNVTDAVGTEEDVLSNTGRMKRKSVIKAENKLKSIDVTEFVPDEFIKYIPHQNIPNCHSIWLQEIQTFGKAFCSQKKCPYTATSAEEMLRHSEEKVCPFYIKPGYLCLKCKFHSDQIGDVQAHVIQRHKPIQLKTFEDSGDEAVVGSESSSESGSSGDEEGQSNGEGEVGAEGEVGKKPKKKKKSEKVECKIKRFHSQKNAPTKDFKKLLPEREPNIADHVAKWYDKFVRQNYSVDPLYTFAAPSQFYHHADGYESYFPKSPISMKFIVNGFNGFVKEIGSAKVSPNQWQYVERMKGTALPSEHTLYAGGPVKCIAWAPLDPHPPSTTQYLAIATKKGIDKFTRYLEPKQSRSLVYIEKYHIDDPLQLRGEINYTFAIDIGPVHCIEFLPSGGYAPQMNRLGLLAVGTVETEIKIYSLPLVARKRDCDIFPFIRLEPSIVLCLELAESPNKYSEEYQSQCMSLVWSQTAGHNFIIAGYLNGFVAIWDISDDDDNLNRFVVNEQRRFVPVSFFYTMDNRINQILAHYDMNGLRWLAVCNSTRKLLLYDLRELNKPLLFYVDTTKNVCNGMDWPIVWENPSYGLGDAMPSHGSCINTLSPMNLVFTHRRLDKFCCGVNDIHYNAWRNIYAAGGDNGDVHVTLLREATLDVGLRLKNDEKAISTLDIVPLDGSVISKKTSQKLPDGWRLFETDYKDKYGVVFGMTQRIKAAKKPEFYGAKRIPPLNLCRLMRVNTLRFNPNRNANSLLAVGYDNGFLRVLRSEWDTTLKDTRIK